MVMPLRMRRTRYDQMTVLDGDSNRLVILNQP